MFLLFGGLLPTVALASPADAGPANSTITSFTPTNGLSAGGTQMVITGTNFVSPTVTIGGTAAAVQSSSGTQITITTPPGITGQAPLTVTTSAGPVTAASPYAYDVDVPAQWTSQPNSDSTCGNWITAINVPTVATTAVATLSGAGGGGGGITTGSPSGGVGSLVTATLTPQAINADVSVNIGCGGGAGIGTAGIAAQGGVGGSGYASGARGGSIIVSLGGTGGGGGGASGLCLGDGTCTKWA